MNPSTPTDKVDRAVPHWFVLIQCNRISTTQKCLASQEQQGLAPETLQVGSHGKKGIAGQTSNRPALAKRTFPGVTGTADRQHGLEGVKEIQVVCVFSSELVRK